MGNFGQRWRNLQPSKTVLFWSCIVCIALTMLLGFTWGGWMTSSTAQKMAEETTERARAELAAAFCVERFLSAADVRTQLASLKKEDAWNRTDVIDEAGWTTPPGMEDPVAGAAGICVDRLMDAKLSPVKEAASADSATTTY